MSECWTCARNPICALPDRIQLCQAHAAGLVRLLARMSPQHTQRPDLDRLAAASGAA